MKKKQKDEIRVKAETDLLIKPKKFIKDIYKQNIKVLEYTFESFFIDSDLEGQDEESQEALVRIYAWARWLTNINTKEIPNEVIRYKKQYVDYSTYIESTEDDDYIYRTTIFYTTIKAIDLNDKIVVIKDRKRTGSSTNKIPKKNLFGKKFSEE